MYAYSEQPADIKLSEAIEYCLTSEAYRRSNHYMCIALKRIGARQHIESVQRMVASLRGWTTYSDEPLLVALDVLGVIKLRKMAHTERQAYTTQFYCWYVFDLKRKGL